ncbi:hypothetical protein ACIPSE_37955 [Streptomyces sp. NPDC090106]|uniref:hypothetical protein n=1 Tax=Streptomyces sp. NPDC090106 TaxID=3365946 RepID=UPI003816BA14
MSTPPRPSLKSIPGTPDDSPDAQQTAGPSTVGVPEGVAREGVPIAVGSDPRPGDGRYVVAMLHIVAPHGVTPSATSTCECGRNRRVSGARRVLALIADHADHPARCPLRTPQEGRTAA